MRRFLVTILACSGCGGAETGGTVTGQQNSPAGPSTTVGKPETGPEASSFYVATESEMPPCDAGRRREIIFITETKELRGCDGSTWLPIDLAGAAGKDGAVGVDGKNGRDGDEGQAGRDGRDGIPGAAGPKGDSLGSALWLYDAAGHKAGAAHISTTTAVTTFITLLDGRVSKVSENTGLMPDANYWGRCFFESNDCSGACIAEYGPPAIDSPNTIFFYLAANNQVLIPAASTAVATASHFSSPTSHSCIVQAGSGGYSTAAYNPTQLTWPLNLPLELRTE